ncbi:hypothetical protein VCRLGP107_460097 [Vibrio crassostreae]|nr:hypothetical protein VCRLGP107_460097 [Vibrio crassostreae]
MYPFSFAWYHLWVVSSLGGIIKSMGMIYDTEMAYQKWYRLTVVFDATYFEKIHQQIDRA